VVALAVLGVGPRAQTPAVPPAPAQVPATSPAAPVSTFPSTPRWSVTVAAGPVQPPVVDRERVFVALASNAITARRLADGSELWSQSVAVTGPLALDGDRLIAVAGDTVQALDVRTGVIGWRRTIGEPVAPVLAEAGWVVVASDGQVTALRGDDGTPVWSAPFPELSAPPAVDGGLLFLPLRDGRLAAVDLENAAPRWERVLGAIPGAPLVHGDRVYLGTEAKRFTCLRRDDGRVEWSWDVGARIVGAPAGDAARVYFAAMDNVLRGLDRFSGALRWKAELAYRPTGGPVVLGPHITVPGTSGDLPGVAATTGRPAGTLSAGALPAASPAYLPPTEAGGDAAIVVVTGAQTSEWTILLAVAPPPPPTSPPAAPAADGLPAPLPSPAGAGT
jgi:outer membrane protein assembly factor BamB